MKNTIFELYIGGDVSMFRSCEDGGLGFKEFVMRALVVECSGCFGPMTLVVFLRGIEMNIFSTFDVKVTSDLSFWILCSFQTWTCMYTLDFIVGHGLG